MVPFKLLVLSEAFATHATHKGKFISGNGVNDRLLLFKEVKTLVLLQLLLRGTAYRAYITVYLLVSSMGVSIVVTKDIHICEGLLTDSTLERICGKFALQSL